MRPQCHPNKNTGDKVITDINSIKKIKSKVLVLIGSNIGIKNENDKIMPDVDWNIHLKDDDEAS